MLSSIVSRYDNFFFVDDPTLQLKLARRWQPPQRFKMATAIKAGFPPIREIREKFEDFFQSGKSGKNRGFLPSIREKYSQSGKKNLHRLMSLNVLLKLFSITNAYGVLMAGYYTLSTLNYLNWW